MALLVGRLTALLDLNSSKFDSGMNSAQGRMRSFGTGMKSLGGTMTRGVTLPLIGIAAAGIKTAADFEGVMNTMGAVAGVPAPKLAKLRDLAIDMGAKTVFSANEAANGMLELSKAGVSVSDIMGGGLANALDLAAAGELDVASAATITSNAMNTFGLNGKRTKEIVDALAGAANASSADVSDLAMALSMGGNAAATVGLTVQETTAALAAFADQGIRGSDAGTSLKTMLLSLSPTTKKAADLQKELGLNFFDSNGQAKDLVGITKELQDGLDGMSQKEQIAATKVLFGTDAFRAANIIRAQGVEGIEKYIEATDKQGAASEVAAARMKGLPGALEMLKGSLETVALAIGDALSPVIQKVAGFLTTLANKFLDLPAGMQQMIVVVGAVVAALGPLLFIVGMMVTAIAAISAPVLIAVGAIGGLVAAGVLLSDKWKDVAGNILQSAREIWRTVQRVVRDAVEMVRVIIDKVVDIVIAIWRNWGDEILSVIGTVWDLVTGIVKAALQIIQGVIKTVTALIRGDWDAVWKGIASILDGAWDIILSILKGALGLLKAAVKAGLDAVIALVKNLPGWIVSGLGSLLSVLYEAGKDLIRGLINGIKSMVTGAINAVKDAVGGIVDGAKSLLGIGSPSKVFREMGINVMQGFAQGLQRGESSVGKALNRIGNLVGRLEDRVGNQVDKVKAALAKALESDDLSKATRKGLKAVARAQIQGLNDLLRDRKGKVRELERVGEQLARQMDRLQAKVEEFRDSIRAGFEGFGDLVGRATSEAFEALDLSGRVEDITDFLHLEVDKVKNLADSLKILERMGAGKELLQKVAAAGMPLAETLIAGGEGFVKFVQAQLSEIGKIVGEVATHLEEKIFGEELRKASAELQKFEESISRLTEKIEESLAAGGLASAALSVDRSVGGNGTQTFSVGSMTVQINAKDIEEMKTVSDFFGRVRQVVRQKVEAV